MSDNNPTTIIQSPEFRALLAARRKLAVPISAIIIACYFGFILLVAFRPSALGYTPGGGHVSIGIYAGLGLLLLSFVLTAVYVRLSDRMVAPLQKDIQNKYN